MPGMMKKGMMYQEGGSVRLRGGRGPTLEGMAAPRGGRRGNPEEIPPDAGLPPRRTKAPSYEEDMTPPRGMRNFRSNAVPTDERPPASRMKKGGMIKKKAGGVVKKAKGGMIGKGCK